MPRPYEPTPGRNLPPSVLASQHECPSRRVEAMWSPRSVSDLEALRKQVCATDRSAPPWVLLVDDGDPEVIAIATGGRIAAVDATGTAKWTSAAFPMMSYPQPTVADLDNDGMPEVIGDVGVVNGEDGSTVATLTGITNSWRTPVAADIDPIGSIRHLIGLGTNLSVGGYARFHGKPHQFNATLVVRMNKKSAK